MRSLLIPVFFIAAAVLQVLPLSADVIITKDDMILNGKILEDKKPQYVRFANYHGTFTIKYKQIKEIHRTESYEGDVEILRKMGKTVNENDIKNNYQSGVKKMEEQSKKISPSDDDSETLVVMLDFFTARNYGKLDSVLPSSKGVSLSGEIPFVKNSALKQFYLHGIDCEAYYFYSENDLRFIKGFSGAAGPMWRLPMAISGYNFNLNISIAAGAGWYSVKNDREKASGVKWNMVFHAGPAFDFHSVIISPQLRFDYIHDTIAPLYSAGFNIGAGYKF